jgi:hypothetical protein
LEAEAVIDEVATPLGAARRARFAVSCGDLHQCVAICGTAGEMTASVSCCAD